jgi:ornithine cyclodeaminase/alanine dehydrogenase-like protein (mu-crystallin family)
VDNVIESRGSLSIINGDSLLSLVPIQDAIDIVEESLRAVTRGEVTAPERWAMRISDDVQFGIMPGAMPFKGYFGAKLIALHGMEAVASHQGIVVLFDLRTASPVCVIDARTLTGLRTAAASAVASRVLARPDAQSLAVLGTGEQALWHVQALCVARPITEVRVWGRNPEHAQRFASKVRLRFSRRVIVTPDVECAVREADIICTTTSACEPILSGGCLMPGQHVNLIGSSTRRSREVDDELVRRSRFFVDSREHALSQAGEFIHAIEAGVVGRDHIVAEIGAVLLGTAGGRSNDQEITAYKSLGHISQDIAVASVALKRCRALGALQEIAW